MTVSLHGRKSRRATVFVAVLFFVSGALALVYEILWTRELQLVLGASAIAQAVVLSSFFAGLGVGNAVAGGVVDRWPRRALAIYGGLELFVGIYALALPATLTALFGSGWHAGDTSGVDALLLSGVAIFLPSAAMGATLPVLARWWVSIRDDLGGAIGALYFANTAGAFVGVGLASFWLIPRMGIDAPQRLAATMSLLLGAGALAGYRAISSPLDPAEEPREPSERGTDRSTSTVGPATSPRRDSQQTRRRTVLLAVALTIGVGAMILEVSWVRFFSMIFGSSHAAFALMLMAFIGGIAPGGLLAAWIARRGPHGMMWGAVGCAASAAIVLALQLPTYELWPGWELAMSSVVAKSEEAWPWYLLLRALCVVAWMAPVTLLTGAVLPILSALHATGEQDAGRAVGRTFGANTVGTVIGPPLALFALFGAVGLRGAIVVAIAIYACGASALAWLASRSVAATDDDPLLSLRVRRRRAVVWTSMGLVVLVAAVAGRFDPALLHAGTFRWKLYEGRSLDQESLRDERRRMTVLYAQDGPEDSAAVFETRGGFRHLRVNGKTDASDKADMATQALIAHIPLVLHRAAGHAADRDRRVFVAGVGSGVTAGSAGLHPDVAVTSVELSRAVLGAVPLFADVNHDVLRNDRVEIVHGDARAVLGASDEPWDVIINQPSNPWVAGNASLFTREYFELCREQLAENGVVAQWMHIYALDDASLEMVLDTFAAVFPHVTLWWPQRVDLLLLGSEAPLDVPLDRLDSLLAEPWLEQVLRGLPGEGRRPHTAQRLLALQGLSDTGYRARFDGTAPHHRDRDPRLERTAAVGFFVGRRARALDGVDERLRAGRPSRLLVGQLSEESLDHEDLYRFFSERKTPSARWITGSLANAVHGEAVEPVSFGPLATSATGLPVFLDAWADRLEREPAPSASACDDFVNAAARHVPQRASVFHRPSISQFLAQIDRCGILHPDSSLRYHLLSAQMAGGSGHRDEARRRISQLRAHELSDAAESILRRLETQIDHGTHFDTVPSNER